MGKVVDFVEGMELLAQGKAIITHCIICDKPFYQTTIGTYAKYCSNACRQISYRERLREMRGGRNTDCGDVTSEVLNVK